MVDASSVSKRVGFTAAIVAAIGLVGACGDEAAISDLVERGAAEQAIVFGDHSRLEVYEASSQMPSLVRRSRPRPVSTPIRPVQGGPLIPIHRQGDVR